MAMNSGKLYAGVARRGAHAPATYSGLGLMQRSSVGEDWVVFSWACRGAEGLRVVTPVHVDPRSSDSDSSSTAAAPAAAAAARRPRRRLRAAGRPPAAASNACRDRRSVKIGSFSRGHAGVQRA